MLGKWIDRAALATLGTVGIYLFFLNLEMGIPASCVLTFACVALARYVMRHCPRRRRVSVLQAEAALLSIVLKGTDESKAALMTLTEREEAVFLIRHPQGVITLDDLFEIWRDRGDGATVIATCAIQDAAIQFAKRQGIDLIDRDWLVKRIRNTGLYVADAPKNVPLLRRLASVWAKVRLRPRMAVYGASLFLTYFATGQWLYLACGLGVTGAAGLKLIEKYAL